jgi:hypothetical protein
VTYKLALGIQVETAHLLPRWSIFECVEIEILEVVRNRCSVDNTSTNPRRRFCSGEKCREEELRKIEVP